MAILFKKAMEIATIYFFCIVGIRIYMYPYIRGIRGKFKGLGNKDPPRGPRPYGAKYNLHNSINNVVFYLQYCTADMNIE